MIDVIVVDDDANVRRGLSTLVDWTKLGARLVLVCKDGHEAVEYLEEHRVDFVISDVKMPQVNGLELSKYIHRNSPETVVVLLSAYNEFDLAQEALSYGVSKYILKPINREKIKELSDLVQDASEAKKQKGKLLELMYNSDFGKIVKKAFAEKDMQTIESVMSPKKYFGKVSGKIIKDYYLFLFNCMAEFARSINTRYVFNENVLYELSKCSNEEEYKNHLLDTYEHIILLSNLAEERNERISVEQIKAYIDKNYTKQGLSTVDIAKQFNLSSSYLGSIFNKAEGCTIVDYITNKKIERAAQLINETDFSIKYIASLVGYGDIQYFSKVFKGVMNMSPSDYAKGHRKG